MKYQDFVVVDTEGKDTLSEIAIVDSQGRLIYQAFAKNHPHNEIITPLLASLEDIIAHFSKISQNKRIICHWAEHDQQVLQNSFAHVDVTWLPFDFHCSYELAKHYFPDLPSYSLEYLSRYFHLKVEQRYFNPNFAHSAAYDAAFTYQLYIHLMQQQIKHELQHKPNPFGTSRVDTPFQNHVDLEEIYQSEFTVLKSVLIDIKQDENYQSKGVVVIGEAGSGKTHLMMRLAKALLKNNRLLFIRQPNNPNTVLYHTYSRILESFVETIPNSVYSQLEYLLAKSFSKIVIEVLQEKSEPTKKDEEFIDILSDDPLNIYRLLGNEGTDKKRKNWQFIEKKTLAWWSKTYGFGGYAISIIKGLIKFCSYSDTHKRDLVRRWLSGQALEPYELDGIKLENWAEEACQEDFALEAISVFGKLSIVDEPLIIIFDQLEGLKYHENLLLNFGEAIKELFTHVPNSLFILNLFPDRWAHFKQFFNDAIIGRVSQYEIVLSKLPQDKLHAILTLRAQFHTLDLETLFDQETLNIILNQDSIRGVLNWASHYYRHIVHNIPLPYSAKNFETEVKETLAALKHEITHIKAALQMIPSVEDNISQNNADQKPFPSITAYIDHQRQLLAQEYHKKVIISDSDDIGKLITIAEVYRQVCAIKLDYLRLGKKKLPEHLLIKTPKQSFVVGFLQINGTVFTTRIKNFNQLVISYKDIRFSLLRDAREPAITGKVGKDEIEKLNNAKNGKFIIMTEADRLDFELIYKLIIDVQNRDFDMTLAEVTQAIAHHWRAYWLVKLLNMH